MNDNFKLIIIIANNTQGSEYRDNETFSSFLQETTQYHIFTSYTPSNIILATKNSVPGKYINESLFSKDDIYQFFLSNDSICFEFDQVFSEIHPIDLIFNMNFPIEDMINKMNSCILFSSQEENDKVLVYENFISKFIIDYFKNSDSEPLVTISAYIINKEKQFNLFFDKLTSIDQANTMLKGINSIKSKYISENSIKSDDIVISLSIQVKCSEITFIKLPIKEPLTSNNTLYDLTSDLGSFVNLDKYEKVYLISCVSPSKDYLKQSIQELYFMNDIYKEINSVKTNNSLHIPLLDSLRSLTSIDETNSNMNNNTNNNLSTSNRRCLSNTLPSGRNNNVHLPSTQSPPMNRPYNQGNLSIIPPDVTISLSETNYPLMKKESKTDIDTLCSYLKSLSVNMNEKNKYETKIKMLEEELNKERSAKGDLEVKYQVSLENIREMTDVIKGKEEMIKGLEEKNKKGKNDKKSMEDLNKRNEMKLIELTNENHNLKQTNEGYHSKYIQLKECNEVLNKRIVGLQYKLSAIINTTTRGNTGTTMRNNEGE